MDKYSTQSRLKGMINRKKRLTNTIFSQKQLPFWKLNLSRDTKLKVAQLFFDTDNRT